MVRRLPAAVSMPRSLVVCRTGGSCFPSLRFSARSASAELAKKCVLEADTSFPSASSAWLRRRNRERMSVAARSADLWTTSADTSSIHVPTKSTLGPAHVATMGFPIASFDRVGAKGHPATMPRVA